MKGKHPADADLVLFHYEGSDPVDQHVADCEGCCERLAELTRTLALLDSASVPERGKEYGWEVWRRLEPRLSTPHPAPGVWSRIFAAPRLAFGAVAALLLVAVLLAGRFWTIPERSRPLTPEIRQRLLLAALSDHLDRSEAVLMEVANAPEGTDISREQARAADLVSANRLYRQSASRAGERAVSTVLDDLERVLLDVAHRPSLLTSADSSALRKRIDSAGVLFRVRVIGTQVRERERRDERKTL